MKLTKNQKELTEKAEKKGFITIRDINAMFSSPISRKANIERLLALNLIKETNVIGKFDIVKYKKNE